MFATLKGWRVEWAVYPLARKLGVLVVQLALACACFAQEQSTPPDSAGITVFPASFFADGEPVSAQDIVNRTPGFAFDRGNNRMRGLESAAGNVLIDGRWPTVKANSIAEVLTSIPFAVIDRVELIRAEAANFDMMGRQVVLNIVRKVGGAATVVTEAALRKYSDNDRDPGGSVRVEYTRSSGRLNLDAGLVYKTEQFMYGAGEGPYTRTAADSESSRSGWFDRDDWQESVQATANGSYTWGRFDIGLNLTAKNTELVLDQIGDYETSAGESHDEVVDIVRQSDVFEIGSDMSFILAPNRRLNAKLLHRIESQGGDASLQVRDLQTTADDEFDWSETAARATFHWDLATPLSLELGVEAAFNQLDSFVELSVGGARLGLPNDNIRVEENRYQGFAKAIARVRSNLSFEAGVEFEKSTLKQSGDANLTKEFDYAKPRLTATWAVDDVTDVRLRFEKVVGQLDFNSFAASPSLESGIFSAGNAGLEPEESQEFELQLERRFWSEGSAIVTYTHGRLKNALDYVPVGSGFDALGNAGKATRDKWVLDLNLPLDRLGWAGATLRGRVVHFDSEIADPFTGTTRVRTGRDSLLGFVGFTWELPEWNSVLGFDAFLGFKERAYRISEERREREFPLPLNVWWDRTFRNDLTLRVAIENLISARRTRIRDIYAAGRSEGEISAIEIRKTEQAPHLMLRVRKSF